MESRSNSDTHDAFREQPSHAKFPPKAEIHRALACSISGINFSELKLMNAKKIVETSIESVFIE
jgi:hypothetical protein